MKSIWGYVNFGSGGAASHPRGITFQEKTNLSNATRKIQLEINKSLVRFNQHLPVDCDFLDKKDGIANVACQEGDLVNVASLNRCANALIESVAAQPELGRGRIFEHFGILIVFLIWIVEEDAAENHKRGRRKSPPVPSLG
jgi:hypothetical protein